MLTDGYIGNEEEIIAEVGRRAGDAIRFWTIGIGSSPNRLLIDAVAKQSGGMSEVLDLNTNPKELVTQVVERIHRAQLADIQIDWRQLAIYETYPRRIPELWAGRPVILFGRYAAGGKTEIALSGTAEGQPLTYTLDVTLPMPTPHTTFWQKFRRLVNAGDFKLDLVPGSVVDVARILDMLEPRATYLDLRQATVVQGLTRLLTRYHLTWRVKDEKTITVGTARRMPGTSVWGYSVANFVTPLKDEPNEEPRLKNFENTPTGFLKVIRTVIDPDGNAGLEPDSIVLIPPGRLFVYGDIDVHKKV